MAKIIKTAPVSYGASTFDAFVSSVDGTTIRSARELKAHNERNGVVNMNEMYSDEAMKSEGFGKAEPIKVDKKEIAADIAEATAMLQHGYKPNIEVATDDDLATLI